MKRFFVCCIILCLFSFIQYAMAQNTVPKHNQGFQKIGYIPFDQSLDDPKFKICDESLIQEYYQVNPRYGEGMLSIKQYFEPSFPQLNELVESDGIIVVRFVINCQGELGRFRSNFFDEVYQKHDGSNVALKEALSLRIKKMGKWTPGSYKNQSYDSYQHLKFRIKNKQIVDVFY